MPKLPPTTNRPDSKDVELAGLRSQTAEQAKQIAELLQRIRELEARLGKALYPALVMNFRGQPPMQRFP
jgi:transposase